MSLRVEDQNARQMNFISSSKFEILTTFLRVTENTLPSMSNPNYLELLVLPSNGSE